MTGKTLECEHCGQEAEDLYDLDVGHRGCRLKAAFPGAYDQDGGLVTFDMAKVRAQLGMVEPLRTDAGLEVELHHGSVWLSVRVQVSNQLSSWTWFIPLEEWDQMVDYVAQCRAAQEERDQ